ncbi:unnamed protein product, partial [Gadus morhua 'NCC']
EQRRGVPQPEEGRHHGGGEGEEGPRGPADPHQGHRLLRQAATSPSSTSFPK